MEQTTDYNEMEEMRRQMAVLKEKLEKEEILSDRLLRNTMQNQVRSIRRRANWSIVGGVCVLTVGPMAFSNLGTSTTFIVVTSLMMLVIMLLTVMMHSKLREADVRDGELLAVARNARRLKDDYRRWRYIGIPLMTAWLVWLVIEVVHGQSNPTDSLIMLTPVIIGGIIGGILGVMRNNHLVGMLDDIIHQIEEK
ncbi:MAG: hypothetical protein IJ139_10105 [Bacteroidaceae bacterium]|nr:hypothetical protein [Bacteroidaceae bacterium]